MDAINNDLNTPQALAVVWSMLKSNIPSEDKYDLLISFDEVLGLNLAQVESQDVTIPDNIKSLLEERETLRTEGKFKEADSVRQKIMDLGYTIKDTPEGVQVLPNGTKQSS
jgi:cysteinyl-tRNA synthetase